MINDDKYSCASEFGAEILTVITSFIIAISVLCLLVLEMSNTTRGSRIHNLLSGKGANLFLTSAYALFLPLMSYMFSQAKQTNPEGRAQVILIWMVLIEFIRIRGDPIFTWGLQKSAEHLVRLLWVGFLVCTYTPYHVIRASLIVLCIYGVFSEVLKGICFITAKDSYLIGKNPKVIHNYMKRIMLEDRMHTTPMSSCAYIVMGEEGHEITPCDNGYLLGQKKSDTEEILTIGRIFQFNSPEDDAFTLKYPNWRDSCLSLALSKMLRRRFFKLPLDEAGSSKALNFVLEGLIDYIGYNRDDQIDGSHEDVNPIERVFNIIKQELRFISEYFHFRVVPNNALLAIADGLGYCLMTGCGIYLIYIICEKSFEWQSLVAQDAYSSCFFRLFRRGSVVVRVFSRLDQAITILLVVACIYIQGMLCNRRFSTAVHWFNVWFASKYLKDPAKWYKYKSSSKKSMPTRIYSQFADMIRKDSLRAPEKNVNKARIHSSVLDMTAQYTFCCIKVDWSIILRLPNWIGRNIPRTVPAIHHSTDAKEAVLKSLRTSGGQLTSGETSLRNHGMEHLNWACWPNGSTTEAILIWHIATTLFHRHKSLPAENNNPHHESQSQQRNKPQQNDASLSDRNSPTLSQQNSGPNQEPSIQEHTNFLKKRDVALELSSYCHYLLAYLPELLPDEVEWTKDMYERVMKDIMAIDRSSAQELTRENRCKNALQAILGEITLLEKGVKLAKDLVDCAEKGIPVWSMLADFWAEMMLFIAPSDNVEGHEKILEREELITQLWALLTHAGILTRSKTTLSLPPPWKEMIDAATGKLYFWNPETGVMQDGRPIDTSAPLNPTPTSTPIAPDATTAPLSSPKAPPIAANADATPIRITPKSNRHQHEITVHVVEHESVRVKKLLKI